VPYPLAALDICYLIASKDTGETFTATGSEVADVA
jgi:hypothetical protein